MVKAQYTEHSTYPKMGKSINKCFPILDAKCMEIDTKATDLQAYSFKAPMARTGHEDFRYSPQYIEI